MWLLEYIVVRLLLAIVPSIIWTILSVVVMSILYQIKGENIPSDFLDCSTYIIITNYILIFIGLLFFYRGDIKLF